MNLDGKKGKIQRHIVSRDNQHPMLVGFWWKSDDLGQTQYLISTLEEKTGRKEHPDFRVIEVKPTALVYAPHKFYKIDTRDHSPARGRIIQGREVEGV